MNDKDHKAIFGQRSRNCVPGVVFCSAGRQAFASPDRLAAIQRVRCSRRAPALPSPRPSKPIARKPRDARVVDSAVQAPESGEGGLDHGLDISGPADIGSHEKAFAAEGFDLSQHGFTLIVLPRGEHNPGAIARELQSCGCAKA